MDIKTIGVEEWLNVWEKSATWDIAQSTISSLTMGELRALDEHVLGGSGVELGVTREGASGKTVIALNIEPRVMGGQQPLNDTSSIAHVPSPSSET